MKKMLAQFVGHLLLKGQMRKINGGVKEGCPPVGTKYFYSDEDGCGSWTSGWNAPGYEGACNGTVEYTSEQPCGYA